MVRIMNREQRKGLILIILIILSIWQTSKLWLGDMSSLSFFASSKQSGLQPFEPESIWINPGAPVTLIYRLGEENREYQSVRGEIEKNIKAYMADGITQEAVPLDWKEILTKKGILYQYPMPITYGEMIGSNQKSPPKNLSITDQIDYVFMQLSDEESGTGKWYLISTQENKSCFIEVNGQFENMKAFNDLLTEESLSYKVKYQPTFNMSGISNKNLFLPIASETAPIPYTILEWHNPLEGEEDFNKFNPYVNHYFLNPLLKKEEITSDGSYIFSELMRAVVKYEPSGVFEYTNVGVPDAKQKISRLEAYNTAKNFLHHNESISKEIKKQLFLAHIEETGNGYIVSFSMRIDGIPVYLSNETRKASGMDYMAQVTVKGLEVSHFKWNAWELEPKRDNYTPKVGEFREKYTNGLNKVLEYIASKEEIESLAIEDMKWVYMVKEAEQDVHVRWIVRHGGEWYSP